MDSESVEIIDVNLAGVSLDLPKWRVPPEMWTDAEGVNFRESVARRIDGSRYQLGTGLDTPLHLLNSDYEGTSYWLYGGDQTLSVANAAGTHFDITPVGGISASTADPDGWTSTVFNGVPVINHSATDPLGWLRSTASPAIVLPGWPAAARAYSMRSFKSFLLAINYFDGVSEFPDQLVWSDAADPGFLPDTWTPAADNLAGSIEFSDTPGGLIDGAPLRGNFVVYKQNSTYLLQFVGAPFVFSRRKLFSTTGVLARNCVAEVEGNHIVLTHDDVIIHDGQTARSLIDTRTRRELFREIDQDNASAAYVFNFKSRDEVWICYPTQGSTYANRALVWNTDHNKLSFRNLLSTDGTGFAHIGYGNVGFDQVARPWNAQNYPWNTANFPWDSNISITAVYGGLGADTGDSLFQELDIGDTSATGIITSNLKRESLDFESPGIVKSVKRVWPRIEGDDGTLMNIRVGGQLHPDDPVKWSNFVPFTIGQDRKIDTWAQGRYLSFEFQTVSGGRWALPGFGVEFADSRSQY